MIRRALPLCLVFVLALSGCATILGTAVSPVTGAVDLTKRQSSQENWYMMPVFFIGGMLAGPFVALYNGVAMDASRRLNEEVYDRDFPRVFRPFDLLANPPIFLKASE
jgi:hypothetical protein